jgi:cation diffusion facilitator CzcD-associated flavoprotein CzcO
MTTAPRQSHLAAIHCAQKALGLSAEDASALKLAVTGQASSATMSAAQRAKYLAHLSGLQERAGLIAPRPAKRPYVQRSAQDDQDERWGKARALWHALAVEGVVHTDTDAALQAYIKRQTKLEHWRFLNTYQVNGVIEALKQWCQRNGMNV